MTSLTKQVGELNFQLGSPSDCDEVRAIAGKCEGVRIKVQHNDVLRETWQRLVGAFDEKISERLTAHISKMINLAVRRATADDVVKDELQALRNRDFDIHFRTRNRI